MKRIEFIAPVEAMRGNLSGAQNLKYPTQNNKAFESPEGSVNYARNYSTRFIGAKRASDGLKYFAVKTKTATHITSSSLMAMALLGGAGAMYAALVRDKSSAIYNNIYAQWIELNNIGNTKSFRRFVMDIFRQMLATKSSTITISGPRGPITINNPWVADTQTTSMQVSNSILAKFWVQLSVNGITFEVNSLKGIAEVGETFDQLINDDRKNILGLAQNNVGPTAYVTFNERYLKYGEGYITSEDTIIANAKYTTTDIQPSAE